MKAEKRDKEITRYIHRLFWRANLVDKPKLFGSFAARFPATFIYNVLVPLLIAYALQAIITRNFTAVNQYAFWLIGLILLYCVLWAGGGLMICSGGVLAGAKLQKEVFANYLNKDYEFFNDSYVGALGAQASRMREALNEYNQIMILHLPRHLITIFAGIIIIGSQSLILALITLVCMFFVLSFTLWTSSWRLKYRRILSTNNSELAGIIGDALSQGTTVKSFTTEQYEERRLNKALTPWMAAQYRSWATSIPADAGRAILAGLTTIILLVITARLYSNNEISIAIVALVQLYVIKMIASTQDLAELIKAYEATMGSAYQAVKTMLIVPGIKDPVKPKRLSRTELQEISFTNVTFGYGRTNNNAKAVDQFTLAIRPGEKVGLVGYSGSGKTTLTKLLLRFMDLNSGSISINGINIREVLQRELRHKIAYVPQEPLLFHRSIAENIGYGKTAAKRDEISKAAEAAYVDEFVKEFPNGYNTLVGERGVKLSGGQRQRVAIARALLKDAPILVLDEATSALDSRSEKYIQEGLWKLMKNRTALVIAHRLSTIQRLDRIVVMDRGKIVQAGTHTELMKQKGIYADLWTHQSGGYIGSQ